MPRCEHPAVQMWRLSRQSGIKVRAQQVHDKLQQTPHNGSRDKQTPIEEDHSSYRETNAIKASTVVWYPQNTSVVWCPQNTGVVWCPQNTGHPKTKSHSEKLCIDKAKRKTQEPKHKKIHVSMYILVMASD